LELYNLKKDPSETKNVAEQHPEIIEKAAIIFKQEHTEPENKRFEIPILKDGLLGDK
jgi:arylsulfatase